MNQKIINNQLNWWMQKTTQILQARLFVIIVNYCVLFFITVLALSLLLENANDGLPSTVTALLTIIFLVIDILFIPLSAVQWYIIYQVSQRHLPITTKHDTVGLHRTVASIVGILIIVAMSSINIFFGKKLIQANESIAITILAIQSGFVTFYWTFWGALAFGRIDSTRSKSLLRFVKYEVKYVSQYLDDVKKNFKECLYEYNEATERLRYHWYTPNTLKYQQIKATNFSWDLAIEIFGNINKKLNRQLSVRYHDNANKFIFCLSYFFFSEIFKDTHDKVEIDDKFIRYQRSGDPNIKEEFLEKLYAYDDAQKVNKQKHEGHDLVVYYLSLLVRKVIHKFKKTKNVK